ncbi:MAG: DUF3467 domain-containing protein [Thermaurantimonas sp.]
MDPKDFPEQQINVEISDDIAGGIYTNLAIINHSASEFVLDFLQIMPGMPKAKVKSRLILTPQHAKRLLLALGDNINKYEASFGKITEMEPGGPIPMSFGPKGQA